MEVNIPRNVKRSEVIDQLRDALSIVVNPQYIIGSFSIGSVEFTFDWLDGDGGDGEENSDEG